MAFGGLIKFEWGEKNNDFLENLFNYFEAQE